MRQQGLSQIHCEGIIYSYYVKYNRLTELINYHYKDSDADQLNIFIDLYSILKDLFSRGTVNLVYEDRLFLVSGLINMCAHYREFFKRAYGTSTKFFIINSNPIIEGTVNINTSYVKDYKKTYSNHLMSGDHKNIDKILKENLSILNTVIPYLPDIEYINTGYEFSVRVLDILKYQSSQQEQTTSLVLTKDMYNISLIGAPYDVRILRPKKDHETKTNVSYIIDRSNFLYTIFNIRKCNPIVSNISPELISIIFALNRCPERGIRKMYNLDGCIKILNLMISEGEILNKYNSDVEYLAKIFISHATNKKHNPLEIVNRFCAVDPLYQHIAFDLSHYEHKFNGMVNLYDPEAVKKLNETVFIKNPLDIMAL